MRALPRRRRLPAPLSTIQVADFKTPKERPPTTGGLSSFLKASETYAARATLLREAR
jgi:hypothetical protein